MAKSQKSNATPKTGWLPSLLGATLLVLSGFSLGLVVGVVKDEPELVAGHLSGRSQEISWATEVLPEETAPGVAAAPDFMSQAGEAVQAKPESEFSDRTGSADDMPHVDLPETRSTVSVSQLPKVSAARATNSGAAYIVQVGAFKASQPAERVANELGKKGYAAYVVTASEGEKKLWRVRVGPMTSRDEADSVSSRLKREEKMMPFVLSEGGS